MPDDAEALAQLVGLIPPPAIPDPVVGLTEACGGRVPESLRALYDRYGPGTFRGPDGPPGAARVYVALLAGDDLTSAATLLSEDDEAFVLGELPPAELTVVSVAWLGVYQPDEELWWWQSPGRAGMAHVWANEVEPLESGPVATLLAVLTETGPFVDHWSDAGGPLRFYPLSQLGRDERLGPR